MKQFTLLVILPAVIMSGGGPIDGYVDHWGGEVPGIITNTTWMSPMPTHVNGKMVFYGPYAMDATAEYRNINYEIEGCIGGIALMSPYNIGDKAWVEVKGRWYGPFCVVDCARRGDMYSIVVHREEVAEVDFEFAQEIGMVSENIGGSYEVYQWYVPVNLLVNVDPDTYFRTNPEKPTIYRDYFLENVEFATSLPRWVMTLVEGEVWKEYGSDRYWIKESKVNLLEELKENTYAR